jgi:hypothetical protein
MLENYLDFTPYPKQKESLQEDKILPWKESSQSIIGLFERSKMKETIKRTDKYL